MKIIIKNILSCIKTKNQLTIVPADLCNPNVIPVIEMAVDNNRVHTDGELLYEELLGLHRHRPFSDFGLIGFSIAEYSITDIFSKEEIHKMQEAIAIYLEGN